MANEAGPVDRAVLDDVRAQALTTYLMGLRQAETFLRERPDQDRCTDERERASLRPTTLEAATRADLEAFMADVLARRAPQHGGHLLQGPQSGHKLQVVDRLTKATMA